jgi:hypothetical protein
MHNSRRAHRHQLRSQLANPLSIVRELRTLIAASEIAMTKLSVGTKLSPGNGTFFVVPCSTLG